MDDLISRQSAIDAHYEYCNKHPDAGFPVWSLKILEDLPSAQPETHDKRTKTHSCDCISRQDAIDAFYKHPNINWTTLDVLAKINALPSAQPEIIRCKDCKHHDGIRCFRWNSTIITKFDDFCSNAERRTDVDVIT